MKSKQKLPRTGNVFIFLMAIIAIFLPPAPAGALDTDVYKTSLRPNVAILFDTSGSMDFGVYEASVDYGYFYNWASEQGDYDLIAGGGGGTNNYFYAANGPGTPPQYPRNEILLVKGNIGVTVTANGTTYTGDAGDPDYLWYTNNTVHTYTFIDADGNLYGDGVHTQRVTVDNEGHVLLDGSRLPLDRDILLHDWQNNPDGTRIDRGFGGQINAPGWYFSGFEGVSSNLHDIVENGDTNVYFFIPGNWINMQMMYNLYTVSWKDESHRTWKTRTLPDASETQLWRTVPYTAQSTNYPNDYPNNNSQVWAITQLDAAKIKVHFEAFNTEANYDYVSFYRGDTTELLTRLSGDLGTDYWTDPFDLGNNNHTLTVKFDSDQGVTKTGFKIDKYAYLAENEVGTGPGYKMQRRIDVVRDAILAVVEQTRGKINWALASFSTNPTGNGAKLLMDFDPDRDDNEVYNTLTNRIEALEPNGGTPLGEAMQDMYNFFKNDEDDLAECSRSFCITISDGFPSTDNDWGRISGKTFSDEDGDGWTEDPYQYTSPPDDYFDDVAAYLYKHSFRDGNIVTDPETSYDNITGHMLSFIQGLPLLADAAEEAGGLYLAAYNKQQLINAFYSLGLLIIKSTSYVAPVISVDTSNKTQSGDMLYMAFFKPTAGRWTGNLKKYRLVKKIKSNCPARTEEEWVVTDMNGTDAVDCNGTFLESSVSYWSDESDGGEVEKGGVGGVLKAAIAQSDMSANPYLGTGRNIYILGNNGTNTQFLPANITNDMLGVASDAERYKVINYIYGYTYAEDGSNEHRPVARRKWPLGSLIHSTPVIVNYENEDHPKIFIVIGGNDGMLHVFKDTDGTEVAAFIPENLLTRLQELDPEKMATYPSPIFFVDGPATYYFTFNNEGKIVPRQLIFGERRGGTAYYSMDITDSDPGNWNIKWMFDKSTSGFAELGQSWSKIGLARFRTFTTPSSPPKVIGVLGGGYDASGNERLDPDGEDTQGRGVFFIDIATGSLVKSFTYSNESGSDTAEMKYAIPSTPLILTDDYGFFSGLYFGDLGGQVWHIDYDNSSSNKSWNSDDRWKATRRVFTANPGSSNDSTETGGSLNATDMDRKMFYAPAATYLGKCGYVIPTPNCVCSKTDDTETECLHRAKTAIMLMFGTGDREQPTETDVHNRIYAVVDPYTDSKDSTNYRNNATPVLNESNLLNVTNDELDVDSGYNDKQSLECILSKSYGWYIKLDDISDSYIHDGEKVLSQPLIFFGKAYITTFTPNLSDPCYPHGEAKIYGLNYCNGTAGLNYYRGNDDSTGGVYSKKYDYRDRYRTIGEAIPSSPKIVIREGTVAAFSSVGGGLPGIGEDGSSKIPQPKFGVDMINWFSAPANQ